MIRDQITPTFVFLLYGSVNSVMTPTQLCARNHDTHVCILDAENVFGSCFTFSKKETKSRYQHEHESPSSPLIIAQNFVLACSFPQTKGIQVFWLFCYYLWTHSSLKTMSCPVFSLQSFQASLINAHTATF